MKFYSARLKLSEELETAIPTFFAAGDGAGVTRGLAQAGASGVQAARAILKRLSAAVPPKRLPLGGKVPQCAHWGG